MLIEPYISVGNLYFTDNRIDVRNKLNESFDEGLKQHQGIKDYYDYFLISEVYVIYDEKNHISAFEFYKEPLCFKGVNLLVEPYGNLLKLFSELDPEIKIDGTGFSSEKYGIGIEAVYASTEDQMACSDSVIVFRKGYYDEPAVRNVSEAHFELNNKADFKSALLKLRDAFQNISKSFKNDGKRSYEQARNRNNVLI